MQQYILPIQYQFNQTFDFSNLKQENYAKREQSIFFLHCFFNLIFVIYQILSNKYQKKKMIPILHEFLNEAQANLVSILIISIPLSFLLSLIQNKYLILALSITASYTIQAFIFPAEKHILWIQQIIVYLLLVVSPRKVVGVIIMLQSFTFLTLIQLRRMYLVYGTNEIDITGILMMQTFLFVGLGYNYQDGAQNPENLIQAAFKRRIVTRPDFLTYLGYVGFLPACLVGPIFQFSDFENYLNRKGDYEKIPNTLLPAIKEMILFFISTGIYLATSSFSIDYLLTPEFEQQNYAIKIFWVFATILHIEFRYISAWGLGMVSMKISGFNYQKKIQENGSIEQNFDRVEHTCIIDFLFHPSFKIKAQTWNMSTQKALRRYVYERVYNQKVVKSEKHKKSLQSRAQFITVTVSAFWHGLYPGYYISFINWGFALQISQEIFRIRKNSPLINSFWDKYKFMIIVEMILSNFCICYFGLFFHLMTIDNILVFVSATYYIPFIMLYLTYLFVVYLGIFSKYRKHENKNSHHQKDSKKVE